MSTAGPLLFPHRRPGSPWGPGADMLTSPGGGRDLRQQRSRAPRPAARRTRCHARGATAGTTTCPHRWPVGGRRPDTCPGRSPPRTPAWLQTLAWPRVPDTSRPDGCRPDGSHSRSRGRSSADGSGSLQLPLPSSRPTCGRPPAALRPGSYATVTGVPAPSPVSLIDRNPPRSRRRSPHQGPTTSTPPHDRRGSRTDPPSTSVAQYCRSSLSHP